MMDSTLSVMQSALPDLLKGALITIQITLFGLLGGFILGSISGSAMAGSNKVFRYLASMYVMLIRGTPLVVQVMFIYFALPLAMHVRISPMGAAISAIAINCGAYIAEVVRGGLQSVDDGLMAAGLALGVPRRVVSLTVVWPIAFRRMIPALGNQFIVSLKDTSILIVIGVGELTHRGQEIIATNFQALDIWSEVALIYLGMTGALALLLRALEKRLQIL